ncbi:DUF3455 domain-containing protein [Polaromonas sp.]|uniref:DUF3455 domain-containing protein n=1 Tax=Polaromonas sp. TaxID=1869339 RepID=UPI00356AF43B
MNTTARPRPGLNHLLKGLLAAVAATTLLGACGSRPLSQLSQYLTQQPTLPADIRVPTGHQAVLEATGSGELQYECQAINRTPFKYAWLPRDRSIELRDSANSSIVLSRNARSWVHRDGSALAVREFVEVPNGAHSLPLQRARVEPSELNGALHNISYIQRIRTVGGVPSVRNCSAAELGMRVSVPYEADYVFWRPTSS